jgi:Transposase DDE domain
VAGTAPNHTGSQAWYSDAAIELVLILLLVFDLAPRQAEGFAEPQLRVVPNGPRTWRATVPA